ADRLKKQISAIQKQISDYRRQRIEALTNNDPYSPYRTTAVPSVPVVPTTAPTTAIEPTQVMPAPGTVRVGGKWLADEIAADRKIADLRQQLMAAQTELQIRGSDARGVESESAEKLQKQLAELEQSIADRVQQKKAELLTSQQVALDNAARQAA